MRKILITIIAIFSATQAFAGALVKTVLPFNKVDMLNPQQKVKLNELEKSGLLKVEEEDDKLVLTYEANQKTVSLFEQLAVKGFVKTMDSVDGGKTGGTCSPAKKDQ
ncbi:MAG: hypothetical protein BroJett040_07000 [Oligoflexia bacterium]|nr:MAG: hypothetical protein BroJett040_07000 [Oligoflexia bacterium]